MAPMNTDPAGKFAQDKKAPMIPTVAAIEHNSVLITYGIKAYFYFGKPETKSKKKDNSRIL